MDKLLKTVAELKELSGFKGNLKQFKSSNDLVVYCRKHGYIAEVRNPSDINKASADDYYTHLCCLAKKYLFDNTDLKTWEKFAAHPDNRKVQKILHEFGVARGSGIFSEQPEQKYHPLEPDSKRITLEDLYEVYQIKHNFGGSFIAFKRQLQNTYGSYAEFCLEKGLDINTTKWESEETALRVAKKLGSLSEVKKKSPSLLKYLEDKKLLKIAFSKEAA